MTAERTVQLAWDGPCNPFPGVAGEAFDPPDASGVYLFTVPRSQGPAITYVGEASSLRSRLLEHVFWLLGGAYELYSQESLTGDGELETEYSPGRGRENLVPGFVARWEELADLARRQLRNYRFYWAVVAGDRGLRRCIESALIEAARREGGALENARLSVAPEAVRRTRVASTFEDDAVVPCLAEPVLFGELGR